MNTIEKIAQEIATIGDEKLDISYSEKKTAQRILALIRSAGYVSREEHLEDIQKILKEIDEISFEPCPYQSCYKNLTADECFNGRRMTENCEWWQSFKERYKSQSEERMK